MVVLPPNGRSFSIMKRGRSYRRSLPSPQACPNQQVVMLMITLFLLYILSAIRHVDAFQQRHTPNVMIPTSRLASPRLLRSSRTSSRTISHHWRRTRSISGAACSAPIATTHHLASRWTTIDWSNIDISAPIQEAPEHAKDESSGVSLYEVATYSDLLPTPSPQKPSPVECIMVRDRILYVKRDDLLRLDRSGVSGNKARKFLALNELDAADFPDVVVSYGGPQSNAMVALAAIVSSKNVNDDADDGSKSVVPEKGMGKRKRRRRFVYYTKKLPRWLRNQPSGNLLRATSLGMELVELSPARYTQLFGGESGGSSKPPQGLDPPASDDDDSGDNDTRCLWVPQGGACGVARPGARVLAEEIIAFWQKNGKGLPLAVCLPGGTCSTALLLDREIKHIQQMRQKDREPLDIKVVVVPCVGDDEYAERQMRSLDISIGGGGLDLPAVLKPMQQIKTADHSASSGQTTRKSKGYFRFGTPNAAILQTYNEMMNDGLFVDLLYGSPAWTIILQHWSLSAYYSPDKTCQNENDYPISGRQVMYIHSGGLEGIASQMTRYKHQGLVDPTNVQ